MARYAIDCADCGGPHEVSRKDGKYCPSCKLLRVLTYLRGKYRRKRKCRVCARPFRPVTQRDLAYCGDCEDRQRHEQHGDTACRFCPGTVSATSPLPNVCRSCLKNPETQDKIVGLLLRGQRERKVLHRAKLATAPNLRRLS